MELGRRVKTLVFLVVIAIFAWPGYQAIVTVVSPETSSLSPSATTPEENERSSSPTPRPATPTPSAQPEPDSTPSIMSVVPTGQPSASVAPRVNTVAPASVPTPSTTTVEPSGTVPILTSTPTSTDTPAPTSTPKPTTTAVPNGVFPGGSPLEAAQIEEWIIRFTNEERAKVGLRTFKHDPAISDIARRHSEQMVSHGLSHTIAGKGPTDRALAAGYDCRAYHGDGYYSYGLAENIAEHPRVQHWVGRSSGWSGYKWSPTTYYTDVESAARSLVRGWMNSPGHRANILDRDSHRIGVGVAIELSTEHGWTLETFFATQNFSSCK